MLNTMSIINQVEETPGYAFSEIPKKWTVS